MERVLSEYVGDTYQGSCLPAYFFHCSSEQYIHWLLGTHNELPELICQLWRGFLCSVESGAHTLCGYMDILIDSILATYKGTFPLRRAKMEKRAL